MERSGDSSLGSDGSGVGEMASTCGLYVDSWGKGHKSASCKIAYGTGSLHIWYKFTTEFHNTYGTGSLHVILWILT